MKPKGLNIVIVCDHCGELNSHVLRVAELPLDPNVTINLYPISKTGRKSKHSKIDLKGS